jgi:hypothetical protein
MEVKCSVYLLILQGLFNKPCDLWRSSNTISVSIWNVHCNIFIILCSEYLEGSLITHSWNYWLRLDLQFLCLYTNTFKLRTENSEFLIIIYSNQYFSQSNIISKLNFLKIVHFKYLLYKPWRVAFIHSCLLAENYLKIFKKHKCIIIFCLIFFLTFREFFLCILTVPIQTQNLPKIKYFL